MAARLTEKIFYFVWELSFAGIFMIEFPLLFDKYSLVFSGTVRLVAFCVFTFSEAYMFMDKFYIRFHVIVFLFIISMFMLIFSPRMISIFFGWDGLGVTSYFLVIYFDRAKSYAAGILTALRNRVGDVCFILRLLYFSNLSSWNFFLWTKRVESSEIYILCMILLLGACTKSAQMPFSAWLPAAIAAPTPVSALVHSSTLVTAGVYVLFRLRYLLEITWGGTLLFYLGRVTIILAGISAMREIDAKKIVALSTLSQLGIIIITLGANSRLMAFFHLLSHAFFKALLFMVVGNMIHLSFRYQDLRTIRCSNLIRGESILIGRIRNFRLIGLPFLSGFYSKDLCIETGISALNNRIGKIAFLIGVILTVLYSVRFRQLRFRKINLLSLRWLKEKSHSSIKGIYYLLSFAVIGSRGYLWGLYDVELFFLPKEFKFMVLGLLMFSFINYIIFVPSPAQLRVKEGIFYMWNLPFIRGMLTRLTRLRGRKFNIKSLETGWLSALSWGYLDFAVNKFFTRFRNEIIFLKSLILLRVGILVLLV